MIHIPFHRTTRKLDDRTEWDLLPQRLWVYDLLIEYMHTYVRPNFPIPEVRWVGVAGMFGFGLMNSFLSVNPYPVDAFTFAASASAAGSVFRSIVGFIFPLFGDDIYKRLGLGGGNSLLAGLAIVLGIPFPVWIYFKGEEMRQKNKLTKM